MSAVITQQHPRWMEFMEQVWLFASARVGRPLTPDDCSGDHAWTRGALERMEEVDVEATLAWVKEHGAPCCHCETIFNIVHGREDEPEMHHRRGQRASTGGAHLVSVCRDHHEIEAL